MPEGIDEISINLQSSRPMSGVVEYEILGSIIPVEDYIPVTGSAMFTDSLATINLDLNDDQVIESWKSIIVRLKPAPEDSPSYVLGDPSIYSFVLEDDDTRWHGRVKIGQLEIPFAMDLLVMEGKYTANFSSDGSGGLPAGEWPVDVSVTPELFTAKIGPISMASTDFFTRH